MLADDFLRFFSEHTEEVSAVILNLCGGYKRGSCRRRIGSRYMVSDARCRTQRGNLILELYVAIGKHAHRVNQLLGGRLGALVSSLHGLVSVLPTAMRLLV